MFLNIFVGLRLVMIQQLLKEIRKRKECEDFYANEYLPVRFSVDFHSYSRSSHLFEYIHSEFTVKSYSDTLSLKEVKVKVCFL